MLKRCIIAALVANLPMQISSEMITTANCFSRKRLARGTSATSAENHRSIPRDKNNSWHAPPKQTQGNPTSFPQDGIIFK